ncbi:hypothetical protein A3G14_03255 [Candidatus Curtissbacteria bacterium RIFCSPLOWO2_12_FULL_38_9]|uniref:Uncharacterized protein n=1 Tax=Candidatus Curtissbacteria bacterium RIFCSPLOWO2_12_FULL_38_9 TaxID=1797735 RepID=A0A1F5I941_9BACT|nr:MAG: hypothetical protein A3G14_03255 [Candidatus Curtissbacteria bacterium RIFCSPLOWO2_12_FULL_38_9]
MQLAFSIKEVFPPARLYGESGGEVTGIAKLAGDVLLILTGAAAIIAFIFIIIGGFKFLTSSGDEKKLASATATLTYAIIGLAVTILAFIIVRLVLFFLRAEVPGL